MMEVLRECWTGRPRAFEGDEVCVPEGLVFEPRPSRPGGPPILVGGMSLAALRRAATRGDGWLAFQMNGLDPELLRELLRALKNFRDEAARANEPFRNVLRLRNSPEMAPRLPDLAARVKELGIDELIVEPPWTELREAERCIAALKEEVKAADAGSGAARDG
jgi:alkanesulfonate monooxygenase SsuD/methylene tetrahydromethanopterin reductase-like flavin-dependent oxidoreductase (luciferase family)